MSMDTMEEAKKALAEMTGQDYVAPVVEEENTESISLPQEDVILDAPVEELPPKEEVVTEPAPEQLPAVEAAPEVVEPTIGGEPATEVAPETYEANMSYTVKGEEKVFDDRFGSMIKTKEDEEFVRDLVTKADGLDSMKESLASTTEELSQHREALAQTAEQNEDVTNFYLDIVEDRDRGDIRSVCNKLGLKEDDILAYSIGIAKERALPIEEQTRLKQDRINADNAKVQQYQASVAEQNYQANVQADAQRFSDEKTAFQQRQLDYEISTAHKDLSEHLKANGVDLAQEVVNTGRLLASARQATDPEVTVPMALEETIKRYSFMNNNQGLPATAVVTPTAPVVKPDAIPTVNGSGTSSAVKVVPTTIEGLAAHLENLKKDMARQR